MTSDPQDHRPESSTPIGASDFEEADLVPPRFRWLKRLALTAACFFLGSVGLNIYATHHARSRLDALIERHRAAGEPVYRQDFAPKNPPPPEENAATYYREAEAHFEAHRGFLDEDTLRDLPLRELLRDEIPPWKMDELGSIIAANAQTFELMRQAAARERVDWGTRFTTPMAFISATSFDPDFQRFQRIAAAYLASSERTGEAFEVLRDMLHHNEAVGGEGHPRFFAHLILIGGIGRTIGTLESILPHLPRQTHIGDSDPHAATIAEPDQIRTLLDALLAERRQRESYEAAMMWVRGEVVDSVKLLGTSGFPRIAVGGWEDSSLSRLVFRPLWLSDATKKFQQVTTVIDRIDLPNFQDARRDLPDLDSAASGVPRLREPITSFLPDINGTMFREYQARCLRRMAAAALAIRWYEADRGRRPTNLDELVPDYLGKIPSDPFAADGRELSYLPDADRPIVYSVYRNGTDDGGAYAVRSNGGIDWRDSLDLPFFLAGTPANQE